ncbi:hypothetical protein Tco_0564139 [Tanacetum coccineum]
MQKDEHKWKRNVLTIDEFTLSSLEVLQGFSFFLQMGFTLILDTLDGLDVGLLEDVIGENDFDDDDCDEEMSLSIEEDEVSLVDGVLQGAFGALGDDSGNDLMRRISLRNSFAFDNIGTHAYECRDIRMRRISLRNSLVGNGYMVNLLVKVTGG